MQNAHLAKKSETYIKMGKEILTLDNIEIEKDKLYLHKTPIF